MFIKNNSFSKLTVLVLFTVNTDIFNDLTVCVHRYKVSLLIF